MQPIISIIIPTYKRPSRLITLLDGLLRQTIPLNKFEILIVDNNSGDETENIVREYSNKNPENIFYFLQEKKGVAVTRNLGIKMAKSDILLFLDDDMSVSSKLIEEHLSIHSTHCNENICVLGYFETEWDKKEDIFLKFLQKSEMQNDWPDESDEEISYQYFYTGNISCAKKVIKGIGGFDEGFTMYGVEDIDLGYRLYVNGVKIFFNKKAFSAHNYNPKLSDFLKKRKQAGCSLAYFVNKYPHLKYKFSFGRFPWIFLGCARLVFGFMGIFYDFQKTKELNIFVYYYFRVLLRWEMYRNFYWYLFKQKRMNKKSLLTLLN